MKTQLGLDMISQFYTLLFFIKQTRKEVDGESGGKEGTDSDADESEEENESEGESETEALRPLKPVNVNKNTTPVTKKNTGAFKRSVVPMHKSEHGDTSTVPPPKPKTSENDLPAARKRKENQVFDDFFSESVDTFAMSGWGDSPREDDMDLLSFAPRTNEGRKSRPVEEEHHDITFNVETSSSGTVQVTKAPRRVVPGTFTRNM